MNAIRRDIVLEAAAFPEPIWMPIFDLRREMPSATEAERARVARKLLFSLVDEGSINMFCGEFDGFSGRPAPGDHLTTKQPHGEIESDWWTVTPITSATIRRETTVYFEATEFGRSVYGG